MLGMCVTPLCGPISELNSEWPLVRLCIAAAATARGLLRVYLLLCVVWCHRVSACLMNARKYTFKLLLYVGCVAPARGRLKYTSWRFCVMAPRALLCHRVLVFGTCLSMLGLQPC